MSLCVWASSLWTLWCAMPTSRGRTSRLRSRKPDLEQQVASLAALMRESRHVIFCTGAGISTNPPASLRDYRGPEGIWTEAQAAGLVVGEPGAKGMPVDCPWDASMFSRMPAARPTLAHRVITQLASGASPLVKHVITQNEDGLHRRSGLPAAQLSELHGSAFVEVCGNYATDDSDSDVCSSDSDSDSSEAERLAADEATNAAARLRRPAGCGAAVVRDFVTYWPDTYKRSWPLGRHVTGRACPHCRQVPPASVAAAASAFARAAAVVSVANGSCTAGKAACAIDDGLRGSGWLHDSTVDFGECPGGFPWGSLNAVHNLRAAKEHMQHADLVVAWGTSLSILANYFDPWHAESKWAKPPPIGLRLALADGDEAPITAPSKGAGGSSNEHGGSSSENHVRPKKHRRRVLVRPCRLVIINKGVTLDEEIAEIKIEADVDEVSGMLLRHLGLPLPPPYDPQADPLLAAAVAPAPGEPQAPWTIAMAVAEWASKNELPKS